MVLTTDIGTMLREHEFTRELSDRDITRLADMTSPRTYQEGKEVFRTGATASECYLIREGRVSVEIHDATRGGMPLQTLGAGKVLGWSWLIPPYKWCFDARAVALTRVLVVDGVLLRDAMEEDPGFGYAIHKRLVQVFADRLHAARLQFIDMFGPMT